MKKISFVQVNFKYGPKKVNAYYLPYSVGLIWSYVNQFEYIKNNYNLDHVLWKRDKIEVAIEKLKDQDIVGFSCYVWNKNYNFTLAKKLKSINPNCLIIFGGPEPALFDDDFFKKNNYIDVVVKKEGELVFKQILENPNNLESIKGLLLNRNGIRVDTGESERISDLDEIPSPYLTGFFDKIIKENPGIEWNSSLETNRGCPYQCTFCDWGGLTYNKIKKFNLEKIFAEIEWISEHKCGHLILCDANFGIFLERDALIVKKIIEVQNKNGFPYTFNTSWAKNQKKEVLQMVKDLTDSPRAMNNGLTLSFQSFTPEVLKNIKRSNLPMNNVSEILNLSKQMDLEVNMEFIIGLPGETVDTWKENIWKALRYEQHDYFNMHQAQLLENAELNSQREIYGLKTVDVHDYFSAGFGSEDNRDIIPETIEMINETNTMSLNDFVKAWTFNALIYTFHINGLTNYISRFVYKYKNIDYKDFYEDFFKFIEKDEWCKQMINEYYHYFHQWFTEGKIDHPSLGKHIIDIDGLTLNYRMITFIHLQNKLERIHSIIEEFVKKFNIDDEIRENLLKLQKENTILFDKLSNYPKKEKFNFDIYGYIVFDNDLFKESELLLDINHENFYKSDYESYLSALFWRRRRKFAQPVIKYNNF